MLLQCPALSWNTGFCKDFTISGWVSHSDVNVESLHKRKILKWNMNWSVTDNIHLAYWIILFIPLFPPNYRLTKVWCSFAVHYLDDQGTSLPHRLPSHSPFTTIQSAQLFWCLIQFFMLQWDRLLQLSCSCHYPDSRANTSVKPGNIPGSLISEHYCHIFAACTRRSCHRFLWSEMVRFHLASSVQILNPESGIVSSALSFK